MLPAYKARACAIPLWGVALLLNARVVCYNLKPATTLVA